MRKALAIILLAACTSALAFAALINSYYDASLQGWVCTYRTAQGTIITQVHKSFCPMSL